MSKSHLAERIASNRKQQRAEREQKVRRGGEKETDVRAPSDYELAEFARNEIRTASRGGGESFQLVNMVDDFVNTTDNILLAFRVSPRIRAAWLCRFLARLLTDSTLPRPLPPS